MAAIPQHVIKYSEFLAEYGEQPSIPFEGRKLRIPRSEVTGESEGESGSDAAFLTARVKRASTVPADHPYEIHVRRKERPAPKIATTILDDPDEPAIEEIEAIWKARLERTREDAYSEGFAAGRSAVEAEFQAKFDEEKQRFTTDLAALQQSWAAFMRDAEPQIVQLTFRIARAILDAPLPDDIRRISERAIAEAVERMADGVPVEILLHPVNYLRIQESGIEDHLNAIHNKLRWRTNSDLKQNEWIVQSPRSATRRLEAELIDQLQRELSLRDTQREEDGE